MFDIGWQEFILIALVAVVVVGPKDLPRVIRTVGQWIRKARSLASEFQGSLEEMAREAELDDVRKQIQQVSQGGVGASIEKHIDPTGELRQTFEDAKASAGADEIESALDETRRDVGALTRDPTATPAAGPAIGDYSTQAATRAGTPGNPVPPAAPEPAAQKEPAAKKPARRTAKAADATAAEKPPAKPRRTTRKQPSADAGEA